MEDKILTIILNIEHICDTNKAYILSLIFLIAIFGIPGILIPFLNYPYIIFEEIIVSSILIDIAL
jgi:hypothetical protein